MRPDGTFVKDRTTSTSSDASHTASSPPLAITNSFQDSGNNSTCSSSNHLNSTNNSLNSSSSLNITNNSSTPTSPNTSISNCTTSSNNNNTSITNNATTINNNTIINNNNITNGPASTLANDIMEQLPIAVAQAAGKPLQEAIEEVSFVPICFFVHSL